MKILSIKKKNKTRFNFPLFFVMFSLLVIGCVFVYSASFYSAKITYGDKFFFLKKQIFGIIVGICCYIFFYFFSYKKLEKLKWLIVIFSYLLLALVFVPGIGFSNYGATRWINLGFITFQPSELAKISFIIFASSVLSKSSEKIKSFKGLIPVLVIGAIFCLLIILEPNMSITICMAMLMVVMLFVGGANLKHFLILAVPAIALAVLLVVIEPYRLKRLVAFVDPFASSKGEGFQLVQSLFGIALGGMFGVGVFRSRQKYLFLPFAESDFILSIIAEEVGFVGVSFLLLLFVVLVLIIFKIARNAPDKFGFLLSVGIGSIIIIQCLLNVAVVTGLIPPTGLPLPFISAGSTSIMIFMSMLGIVQNVHKHGQKFEI